MSGQTWPLGLYCERTMLGFWGEPLNAITNLAFVLAAFLCWREVRRSARRDLAALWLIVLMVLIGLGSGAFHTFPSRTTVLMDVIPIGIFILSAIVCALRFYLGARWWLALGAAIAFTALSPHISALAGGILPRGSAGYAPALLAMPLIAGGAMMRAQRAAADGRDLLWSVARRILLAALVFALSLTFRTLDQPFCTSNPFGLHFLWHLLNAAVLYLITTAHIRFCAKLSA